MPEVSVIIPVHNFAHYIGETLNSVLAQIYTNFEIVVVDDGSTDNLSFRLSPFRKNIKLVRHFKNMGFAQALNTGVKNATGKYICFLSADDVWEKDFLSQSVAVLQQHPQVGLVHSPPQIINNFGKPIKYVKPFYQQLTIKDEYFNLIVGNFICLASVVTQTQIVKSSGLFNPKLRQNPDWDMWLKIARRYPIAYLPRPLVKYRHHSSTLTWEVRRDLSRIGSERAIILRQTLKNQLPAKLKFWMPFLFIDAFVSLSSLPQILKQLLAWPTVLISSLVTRFLRLFVSFRLLVENF